MTIKLKIKGKTYTIEEARELYNELKALFGESSPVLPYYPPVNVPWVQPYPSITPITCATVNDTPENKWFYDAIEEKT